MEPMEIDGAWVCPARVHRDRRGSLREGFRGADVAARLGYRPQIRQTISSTSQRGVIRGIHFAEVPPGQAKYVWCVSGTVMDVVVDLRVGSPTYTRWESVTLDPMSHDAVFISEGLGHAFIALTDEATLIYLCSTPYSPATEHVINPFDATIGISWPDDAGPWVLSERDAAAPSLGEVEQAGLLPSRRACELHVAGLQRPARSHQEREPARDRFAVGPHGRSVR